MQASTQLPRLDRQGSMFRQSRSFQPLPGPGSLGPVTLRNPGAIANRGAFVGQQATTTVQAPTQEAPPVLPTPAPAELPAADREKAKPGLRLAWGRLKKMDAEQLAAELEKILERARARNVSAGMIARIQERLAQFSKSAASSLATVEITEPEVRQMEAEILSLEEAEAQDEGAVKPLLIAAGVIAAAGILSMLFGD